LAPFNVREHPVNMREHSDEYREHSVNFRKIQSTSGNLRLRTPHHFRVCVRVLSFMARCTKNCSFRTL
jgi:hypothetical protein